MPFLLAMTVAVLLLSACSSVEGIGHTDLAWKTYNDPTYGYSIEYPHDWEAGRRYPESAADFDKDIVDVKGEMRRKYDGAYSQETLRIEAGATESWCSEAASRQTTEITVDGHEGVQVLCFREPESCEPEPNCWALPYAFVRHFPATDTLPSLTFIAEPTSDPFLMRRMLDTLRFTGSTSATPTPIPSPEPTADPTAESPS